MSDMIQRLRAVTAPADVPYTYARYILALIEEAADYIDDLEHGVDRLKAERDVSWHRATNGGRPSSPVHAI